MCQPPSPSLQCQSSPPAVLTAPFFPTRVTSTGPGWAGEGCQAPSPCPAPVPGPAPGPATNPAPDTFQQGSRTQLGRGEEVKGTREHRWKRGLFTRICPPLSVPDSCWKTDEAQSRTYWLPGQLHTAAVLCDVCAAGAHSWLLSARAWW